MSDRVTARCWLLGRAGRSCGLRLGYGVGSESSRRDSFVGHRATVLSLRRAGSAPDSRTRFTPVSQLVSDFRSGESLESVTLLRETDARKAADAPRSLKAG